MRKVYFATLVAGVLGIGILHFVTPGHLHFYHDTYRRLSYFPIVLGALSFGFRGGLILAVLASIAFIPHLLLFLGKSSDTYLSELTEIALYLAAGTVTGFVAGREKKLREQYKLLSEKLEKSYARLHRETEQLIEAEDHLAEAQKFSALGQLSASLAHEIRNPLGSIKGTAEILLDDFPEGHPKREFLDILLKEASRLNSTVEEVLHYSRGQRSGDEGSEPVSVVVARIGKLLDKQIRGKKLRYSVDGPGAGEDFFVAGGKFSQVLLNVLLNAIDAVDVGGTIRLRIVQDEGGGTVEVCDNGPGIPDDQKDKVFEPFFSGKEDGTGLGLLISKKIVEGFGGSIAVSDSREGGACFRIVLPSSKIENGVPFSVKS